MIYSCNAVQKSWKCFNHLVKIPVVRRNKVCLQKYRNSSTQALNVKEIQVPVPYGHLASKVWGSDGGDPVLALHGWQDNCGTFDRLIPLLPSSYQYYALDFPGHGLSSHRPNGSFYTYLNMVLDLKRFVDHFQWKKINFIAHSMGGEIALLWSGMYPETVDKLVLLDTSKPYSNPLNKIVKAAVKSIKKNLEIEEKLTHPPRVYSEELALKRLIEGMDGEITEDSAKILLKRGTKFCPNQKGLLFNRDLRIKTIEPFHVMSHDTVKTFVVNIDCEMLILISKNSGPRFKYPYPDEDRLCQEIFKKNCKKFTLENIEGNHFVHLNEPAKISPYINAFLKS